MLGDTRQTAHRPLSQHTIRELCAKAEELRAKAIGLELLAASFDELAERRAAHEASMDAETLALRIIEAELPKEEHVAKPGRVRPTGLPSPQALQMATDVISRHYISPDIRQAPAIIAASLELSYLLMAYGLVPAEPELDAAQSDMAGKPRVAPNLERPRDTDHHILVVDDVADVLVAVGAFLVREGYAVQKAANGDEALRIIASDPRIDVLVTDFAMPGLTGSELINQVVQIRPNLKALVITGYPNADGLAELSPSIRILVKPFRRDTLIAEIKTLLGEMPPVLRETAELTDQLETAELVDPAMKRDEG
jgi:CheY-like chemotaxis protein